MKHRDQILRLRAEGKTYDEIKSITGASKGTISFHCGKGQKAKYNQRLCSRRRIAHPYARKLEKFLHRHILLPTRKHTTSLEKLLNSKIRDFYKNGDKTMSFSLQDLIDKFGESPKCYLTGKPIDIYQPKTYQFDHIIPTSKGGSNSIENLGICTKAANMSKTNHTLEEFLQLCKDVLINNGYTVSKN